MASEDGRPQDQGRRHRRAGAPSPETATLLARSQQAMRDELSGLLNDIRGRVPDPGVGILPADAEPVRPSLKDRAALWDLAIKLMKELGTEVDPGPLPGAPAPAARTRRRGRVDFG